MDDSATATTFPTHGLNPSKILPAPPPTIQGLYHQNTFPCPVLSERGTHHPPAPGAPYRRPAPGAARPPRSLSAAAQITSAARRFRRPHLQPGAGDAPPRPDGLRHPRTTRAPGRAMRRPPRSPLLPRHCRAPPRLTSAAPSGRAAAPSSGAAAAPARPASLRRRRRPPQPPHPRQEAAREGGGRGGAGRRHPGGLVCCMAAFSGQMLAGWGSVCPFLNPARCAVSPRVRLAVCFPGAAGDAPPPHQRAAAEKQGLLLIEMTAEPA